MEVPRRSIHFVERGNGAVLASIICEDLAQIDELAEVIRSVGPTIVVTPLLDGPQLSSRWAGRYASVLVADDPGSAVLTLTSYGMAQRSRPNRHDPSSIVALWKDPVLGTREIPLETGAHGVLLTASVDLTVRRSGDGLWPVDNCMEFFDVSIFQVRAAESSPPADANGPAAGRGAAGTTLPERSCASRSTATALAPARSRRCQSQGSSRPSASPSDRMTMFTSQTMAPPRGRPSPRARCSRSATWAHTRPPFTVRALATARWRWRLRRRRPAIRAGVRPPGRPGE